VSSRSARLPFAYADAGATFDEPARIYRYRLWRRWGPWPGRLVVWVLLNPSTADAHVLDPTLRRCEGFSRAWGYDGMEIVNLFALRSTDPQRLYDTTAPAGESGPAVNDRAILAAAARASLVVCGWGRERLAQDRARAILADLREAAPLHCLGTNADGSPRHPLYLAATTPLQRF
jgi:hypothetical protein